MEGAVTQARALEIAQKNSQVDHSTEYRPTGAAETLPNDDTLRESADTKCAASGQQPRNSQKCYFCGNSRHPRYACPAKDATRDMCQKKGHFAKLCQSPPSTHSSNVAAAMPKLAPITCKTPSRPITSIVPNCLTQAQLPISINNVPLVALVDSGSSETFIDYLFCIAIHLMVERKQQKIELAADLIEAETHGQLTFTLKCNEKY